MHEVFHAAGVPHPDLSVQRRRQVKAFAARVGYPLVLKPDVGVGAAHTFKVSSDEEVDAGPRPARCPPPTSPRPSCAAPSSPTTGSWTATAHPLQPQPRVQRRRHGAVLEQRDISFWSLQEHPPALEALGRKAVAALGLREHWFHLEFFRLPDGSFVVLEANLRPPGGFMTDMMNYTCDIDVYRLWARVRHRRGP